MNSSSKEEDIKLYISKDDDISRILYIKYSSQSGDYGYFYWRIFVDIACRQEIKLDWSPTLQQKRFFVRRLFLFSFSILDVEKNWIFVWSWSCCRTELQSTAIHWKRSSDNMHFAGSSLDGLYSNSLFYSTLRLSGQLEKNSFHFVGMRNIIGYLRFPCQGGNIIRTTYTN